MLWLLILLIIAIVPIPVKTYLNYHNGDLILKIYNKEIDLNTIKKKVKVKYTKTTVKKGKKNTINTIKSLIKSINKIKFKPILKIDLKVNYGFEDAALTGILYGIIYSLPAITSSILYIFFNIKKFKFNIVPQFNKKLIDIEIISIISINLAKIIYITLVLLIKFKKIKKKHKKYKSQNAYI